MRSLESPEELQRAIAEAPRLVVHLTASWNAQYDSEMQRCLELLRSRYNERIVFATANTDVEAFGPLVREWRVLNLPALALFAFGRHVSTQVGLRSERQLAELCDTLAATHEYAPP
jgi:thioredoxin-like negative regulator of GroEL